MPSSPAAPGSTTLPGDRLAELRTLGEQLPRFIRVVHALKAQATEGRDRAALVLLFPLRRLGPLRQSALAELVHADPSTVSRHVARLARAGFVQRRPHPQDGRAVQLVATEDGERVVEEIARRRQDMVAAALAHWDPDDVQTLVHLLSRLNDDLEANRPQPSRAPDEPPQRGPVPPAAAPLPDPRNPDQEK